LVDVVVLVIQLGLTIWLSWSVIGRDLRRLGSAELDRTWGEASFWVAVVCFAPLSILVHFIKARRSIRGVLLGVGWMLGVVVAVWVAAAAVELLLTAGLGITGR
jgi:hypothetical protein